MQTFFPYTSPMMVSVTLDMRRLGKQRVEARQILNILDGINKESSWRNHVAVRMWKGYETALKIYLNHMIFAWKFLRHKNNNMSFEEVDHDRLVAPPWLLDERFTLSHRCNLMRKDPEFYGQFGWKNIDVEAPYWWPVSLKDPKKQEIMVSYWGK